MYADAAQEELRVTVQQESQEEQVKRRIREDQDLLSDLSSLSCVHEDFRVDEHIVRRLLS